MQNSPSKAQRRPYTLGLGNLLLKYIYRCGGFERGVESGHLLEVDVRVPAQVLRSQAQSGRSVRELYRTGNNTTRLTMAKEVCVEGDGRTRWKSNRQDWRVLGISGWFSRLDSGSQRTS